MRYLFFFAAVLTSGPACAAEFTDTIELRPGFAERWQAPRPFKMSSSATPTSSMPFRAGPIKNCNHREARRRYYQYRAKRREWRAGRECAGYQSSTPI